VASESFLGVAIFLRRLGYRWCRIAYSGAVVWIKMDDCFREMFSNEQIFDVLNRGFVNGGRTREFGYGSSVFLFFKKL